MAEHELEVKVQSEITNFAASEAQKHLSQLATQLARMCDTTMEAARTMQTVASNLSHIPTQMEPAVKEVEEQTKRIADSAGAVGDAYIEHGKQMRSLAFLASRVSPEAAAMAKTFRALLRISESFGEQLDKLGLNLAGMVTLGATFAILKTQASELEQLFKGLADAIKETSEGLKKSYQKTVEISTNRMLEGGVTEEEKNKAQAGKDLADANKKALEDYYMELHKMASSSVNGKGDDTGVAKVISSLMKSGLYTPQEINEITKNGKVYESVMDDLSKKIDEASKQSDQYKKVLDQYEKERKEAAREEEKAQKKHIQGIIDNAKEMLRKGEDEMDELVKDWQEELDQRADDADWKKHMTTLDNAPMWLQDELRAVKIGGEKEKRPTLATPTSIERFLNAMDRLGGYTSNIANMQLDPKLAEMRKQTQTLTKIEKNTQRVSARYN